MSTENAQQPNSNPSAGSAKLPVIRRPFDAEIKDGKVVIYTNHYDEFGDVVWTANFIEPERFKELAKKYWSIAAFL